MAGLNAHHLTIMLLSLGVLLLTARIFAEIARKLAQPPVLGELLAGVLLGPTLLGTLAPAAHAFLFPQDPGLQAFFGGFRLLAVVLFLLVAGMEVDLSTVWRQGRSALSVSLFGIFVPGGIGFALASVIPNLLGREPGADPLTFRLFFAIAMAISALPVIAKTLLDLNLYRSDLGMVVIASAVFDDLTGWLSFALVLSLMNVTAGHDFGITFTVICTLGFTLFMLTAGRALFHRMLPWVQAHTTWPGGVLGLSLSLALIAAALTEWIGIHAIFGSFLMGIAIGDSSHLREQTRQTINQFVSFIFAPLFFASIGLQVNFVAHFDWQLTIIVLLVACAGKIVGCTFGARLGGMPPRESLAIGFAMNARGAMEIVLGLLALQNGLIGERMFVSLVVMAIVTSMMSGPMMRSILQLRRSPLLSDFLAAKGFVGKLTAKDRYQAIRELSEAAALSANLDPRVVETAVLEREALMPTGIGHGIAIPHARIEGLARPVVAFGMSEEGVDFDAPDGVPAELVFLVLTSYKDGGAQVSILADIARKFGRAELRQAAHNAGTYTEFLAVLRTFSPQN